MTESSVPTDSPPPAPGARRPPLLMAAVTALSLGGAGYMAVGNGLLPGLPGQPQPVGETPAAAQTSPPDRLVFLALEPFMLSLPRTDPVRQLRLEVQVEVPQSAEKVVNAARPRLQDTMNTYLRSIDLSDIQDPDTLLRMRLQLLRRLQVAAGDGLIRDLLITQFLIS